MLSKIPPSPSIHSQSRLGSTQVHYNCLVPELQHSNCKPEMHTLFAFFSSIPDLKSTHTNIRVSRLISDTWMAAFVDSHDHSFDQGKDQWDVILHFTSLLILKKYLLAYFLLLTSAYLLPRPLTQLLRNSQRVSECLSVRLFVPLTSANPAEQIFVELDTGDFY